jgi:2-dehydro-3-deoxygalactonokinase
MRGAETQVFGALAVSSPAASRRLICLPGTHSKWVLTEGDGARWRIERFATFMTGEAFAVLKRNSILGRLMREGPDDAAAFDDGLARSGGAGGLLHHLFMVRTEGLFDVKSPMALPSFMSGLLIGHELRAALAWAEEEPIAVIGAPDLSCLYARALTGLARRTEIISSEAASAQGLLKIAAAARLLAGTDET